MVLTKRFGIANVERFIGWFLLAIFVVVCFHLAVLVLSPISAIRTHISDLIVAITDILAAIIMMIIAWNVRKRLHSYAVLWLLIGLGQSFSAIGDIVWLISDFIGKEAPFPSIADIFYLMQYPIVVAGAYFFLKRIRSNRVRFRIWIDIATIMLASVLAYWNFLVGPLLQSIQTHDLVYQILSIAYPIGDLALIMTMLILIYSLPAYRKAYPFWVLILGYSLIVITDTIFAHQSMIGTYQSGNLVDIGWSAGYAFSALAGFLYLSGLPPLQFGREREEEDDLSSPYFAVRSHNLYWIPYCWVAAAYMILIARYYYSMTMSPLEISLMVGIVILLVIARQLIVLRENEDLSKDLRKALDRVNRQACELEQANGKMHEEITERMHVEERLLYDAMHDSLTGLPNRSLFLERLTFAEHKQKRHSEIHYSVLFLDLDSFKIVNDSLGHLAGDRLLVRMAKVLRECLRTTDTVARLGGDEFVVLLEEVNRPVEWEPLVQRLQEEISHPFLLDGIRIVVTVSIGVVRDIDGYHRPEDLLRDADLAMYQAKQHGKACYQVFQESMRESAILRMALESDLRSALDRQEFVIYYQPVVRLPGCMPDGMEALVRWNHPQRGLVPPGDFIHLAEETGLIIPLGTWILVEACRQARKWKAQFPTLGTLRINVNISARQLKQADFIDLILLTLQATGLPAHCLVLEVTESIYLEDLETVSSTLKALRALGVESEIDDFGTGYSSLSYLQHLPVQTIKIDRTFIRTIRDADTVPDIVRGILLMIKKAGFQAVAEGIETEQQLTALSQLDCDYGQGFLMARPMDATAATRWLNEKVSEKTRAVRSEEIPLTD